MSNIKYKIICINLKRRPDRRATMENKFAEGNVKNYSFFEAYDGRNIDLTNPQLNLFKHDYSYLMTRRGNLGCALSHYNIWINLVNDDIYNTYVILEDDINLAPDFQNKLDNFISQMTDQMYLVYLGFTVKRINFEPSRKIYQHDTSYNIYPITKQYYEGGAFGYIITKKAASILVDGIQYRGIKNAIDDVANMYCPNLYETRPSIVFTDAVGFVDHFVDSDIQTDFDSNGVHYKVNLAENQLTNNYTFDNYIFYPNLDSPGGDIKQLYCDIAVLKRIADNMDNCIAFNTGGWLKHTLIPQNEYVSAKNNYYAPEGLYVKKSHVLKTNNYIFEDYDFFPNLDSYGGDIVETHGDIFAIKKIADITENCVAFNTYGWLKKSLKNINDFIVLENKHYVPDGIYIKKNINKPM